MNMNRIVYFICALSIGLLSACTVGLHTYQTVGSKFDPKITRIEMNVSDLELLGEVKVSAQYRTYFGSICVFDKVNEDAFNIRITRQVHFVGNGEMNLSSAIQLASYKVIDQYPDADFYVPVLSERSIDGMFLGAITKEEVRFKVYKLKK